jgi:hypothetical protein
MAGTKAAAELNQGLEVNGPPVASERDPCFVVPRCQTCGTGYLVPFSDYGDGAPVIFKAYVCINPDCGWSIRIDKGVVTYGRRIEQQR